MEDQKIVIFLSFDHGFQIQICPSSMQEFLLLSDGFSVFNFYFFEVVYFYFIFEGFSFFSLEHFYCVSKISHTFNFSIYFMVKVYPSEI